MILGIFMKEYRSILSLFKKLTSFDGNNGMLTLRYQKKLRINFVSATPIRWDRVKI